MGGIRKLFTYKLAFLFFLFSFFAVVFANEPLIYNYDTSLPIEQDFDPTGAFQTDLYTGAATYTYNFNIPSGTKGIQPGLFLAYSSHLTPSRPSVVGSGWRISENYIQRDVNFTRDDASDDIFKLVLNGQTHDLIYMPNEGRYRTKIETFMYVNNQSTTNNQKGEYWVVNLTDGTSHVFGLNDASEMVNTVNPLVWRWSLDAITDTYNNTIYYTYEEDPHTNDIGAAYLKKIEYNNDKKRVIDFTYESSDRPDIWVNYIDGHKLSETRRLDELSITVDSSLVRKYEFTYVHDSQRSPAHSFLDKMVEFGDDGTTSLPQTTFGYHPAASETDTWEGSGDWVVPNCNTGDLSGCFVASNTDDNGVRLADVNRDGFVDLLKAKDGSTGVHLNLAPSWSSASNAWTIPDCVGGGGTIEGCFVDGSSRDMGVRLADINSDGLIDILRARETSPGSGAVRAHVNVNPSWAVNTTWDIPECATSPNNMCFVDSNYADNGVRLVDVNGDGYTDVLRSKGDSSGGSVRAIINNHAGWTVDTSWNPIECTTHSGLRCFVNESGVDQGIRLVDVNGDGLTDMLWAKEDAGGGTGSVRSIINTGSGWTVEGGWDIPNCDGSSTTMCFTLRHGADNGVRIIDINGDGLPDLVRAHDSSQTIVLNNGFGWTNVGDIFKLLQCDGSETRKCFTDNNDKDNGVRILDINGDLVPDVVDTKSPAGTQDIDFRKDTGINLLVNITNSFGGRTSIKYKPSTYSNNTGNDNRSDLGFPLWVVENITNWNGLTGEASTITTTAYNYSNGSYAHRKQDFRGFGYVQENRSNNVTLRHWFHQDDARKGREYQIDILDSHDISLYQRKLFNWTKEHLDTSNAAREHFISNLIEEKTLTFDGETTSKNNTIFSTYDVNGNLIIQYNDGDEGISDDGFYEYYSYVNNSERWILNTVKTYNLTTFDNATALRSTQYSYDHQAFGQPPINGSLTLQEEILDTGDNPIINRTYDAHGNVDRITDPMGDVTDFVYGLRDTTFTLLDQEINAKGQTTENYYDLGTGNLLSTLDPNGYNTSFTYDVFGRVTSELQPLDTASNPTVEYEYAFDGVAPENITIQRREQNNTGNTLDASQFYDGFGNVIQVKREAEDTKQIVEDTLYDGFGRKISISNRYLVATVLGYSSPDSSVARTNFTYDPLDRLLKVLNPDGTEKDFNYSHWNITVIDEEGNQKINTKDTFDQITSVVEFIDSKPHYTDYAYNVAGDLFEIKDSQNNIYGFSYDTLGRRIGLDDPDLGIWNYTYNKDGNLITTTDPRSITTNYGYDPLDRVTDKNTTEITTHYIYDESVIGTLSSVGLENVSGTASFDDDFHVNFTYDERLRKVDETKVIKNKQFKTDYDYDSLDRPTSTKLPDGQTITYNYTTQGPVETISGITTETDYNEADQILARTYDNSLTTQYSYNTSDFRLEKIKTSNKQELRYGYSDNGNVITIEDIINSTTYTLAYDALSRLISAKRQDEGLTIFDFVYVYNSIGNMISLFDEGEALNFTYEGNQVHAPSIVWSTVGHPVSIESFGSVQGDGLSQVFAIESQNNRNVSVTDFHWNLSTGESLINGNQLATLTPDETVIVLIQHNYTATGTYNVTAGVNTTLGARIDTIGVTI